MPRLATPHEFAGRVSGDSTVAYAIAFARAVEQALGVAAPPRGAWLRALMGELERLANHFGDIGAICNDASLSIMLAHCAMLRERVLRAASAWFGHRLMMDAVVPGGVAGDLGDAAPVRTLMTELRAAFRPLVRLYDDTASLQDRTVGTGIVRPELAERFAAGGFVGRASGRSGDVRKWPGYSPYDVLSFEVPALTAGDVNARVWVRIREIEQSFSLIEQILVRPAHRPGLHRIAVGTRRGLRADGRVPRRRVCLGPGCGGPGATQPLARPVLVSVAAAGSRDRGQHRRGFPAMQQILQLFVLGP